MPCFVDTGHSTDFTENVDKHCFFNVLLNVVVGFGQSNTFEIFWIKFMVQQWNLYVDLLQNLHRIFQVLCIFRPDPKPIKVNNTNLFFFTLMSFGSYPVCEQQWSMCYLNLQNTWSHVTESWSVLALLMGVVKPSRPGFWTLSLGYKSKQSFGGKIIWSCNRIVVYLSVLCVVKLRVIVYFHMSST